MCYKNKHHFLSMSFKDIVSGRSPCPCYYSRAPQLRLRIFLVLAQSVFAATALTVNDVGPSSDSTLANVTIQHPPGIQPSAAFGTAPPHFIMPNQEHQSELNLSDFLGNKQHGV